MPSYLETDLLTLSQRSAERTAENDRFVQLLRIQEPGLLDAMVQELNATISPQIECTACGNCCKTLLINVSADEANSLSTHLQQDRAAFDEQFLEKGAYGMMVVNAVPCHFLAENKCTVYEYRFEGCREFPAMHLPGFHKRLFTTFMHYGRCPIIYNIVEGLKQQLQFEQPGK